MRTFRIDPLNEHGTFDHSFYESEEYAREVNALKRYLKEEGFDNLEEEFVLTFNKRTWACKPGPWD